MSITPEKLREWAAIERMDRDDPFRTEYMSAKWERHSATADILDGIAAQQECFNLTAPAVARNDKWSIGPYGDLISDHPTEREFAYPTAVEAIIAFGKEKRV